MLIFLGITYCIFIGVHALFICGMHTQIPQNIKCQRQPSTCWSGPDMRLMFQIRLHALKGNFSTNFLFRIEPFHPLVACDKRSLFTLQWLVMIFHTPNDRESNGCAQLLLFPKGNLTSIHSIPRATECSYPLVPLLPKAHKYINTNNYIYEYIYHLGMP